MDVKRRAITMKEVAEKAGVSQATVSRVLNGDGIVSPTKRASVLEWVRKLDYRPNFTAKTLAADRSFLIGMVLPDLTNLFYLEIVEIVEALARREGYNLILVNSEADSALERSHLLSLRARQVDGVLLVPCSGASGAARSLSTGNTPAVCLTLEIDVLPSVAVSHRRGGIIVAEHLAAIGRHRILTIGSKDDEKLLSFDNEIRRIMPDVTLFSLHPELSSHTTIRSSQATIHSWLQNNDTGITGVFAANDVLAIGAMNAFLELGTHVPEEVAIVGFDDTYLAEGCRPTLTSVAQPIKEMGKLAFDMLMRLIDTPEISRDLHTELEPRLVVRESTMGIGW